MAADNSPASPVRPRTRIALLVSAICILASLAILGLTARRIVRTHQTPGPFNINAQGFCDFQNGVYFPSQAFLQKVSPYSQQYAEQYPVPRSTPFYSPFTFALHLPFALPRLEWAEPIYFGWMVILALGIALLTGRWICDAKGFAAADPRGLRGTVFAVTLLLLVASRGGQQTLYTGYFTFEIILACLIAVHYAKPRPWLSGLCLAVVACKPNYLLPLGFLMLARGNFKALSIGAIISITTALACALWIMPEGGIAELLQQIEQTQQIHKADPIERPVNSWIRLDWPAVMAKWLQWDPNEWHYLAAMMLMVLPTAIALRTYHRRNSRDQGSAIDLGGSMILVTTLVSVYHHAYDAPLVIPLVMQLALILLWPQELGQGAGLGVANLSKWLRFILLVMTSLPLINYASSQAFLERFQIVGTGFQVATSLNGLALVVSWSLLMAIMIRQSRQTIDKP